MKKPLVSIICDVYNHEKYIGKALDSFISQVTDFEFEILVHDDASTDSSQGIIEKYAEKYPNLVKPMRQKYNQYSKGKKIDILFQYPRVKGIFIAFCEGDDCWCDKFKLQKQVNALLKYPDIDICTHASYMKSSGKIIKTIKPINTFGVIPLKQVISGGGGFVATSSIMIRSKVIEQPKKFYMNYPFDYSLQIMGSLKGGMLFLPDVMSVYNYATENSWSRSCGINNEKAISWQKKVISMLKAVSFEIPKERESVEKTISLAEIDLYAFEGRYFSILKNQKMLNLLTPRQKLKIIIGAFFGNKMLNIIKKIRYRSY